MKKILEFTSGLLLLLTFMPTLHAQQKIFNQVIGSDVNGVIDCMTQDKQGYIWYGCEGNPGGLHRYSASGTISYFHNPNDSNSLANNPIRALCTDSSGMIWIGTRGGGIDEFNPVTHTFTHFRHNPKDPGSLSNDTVHSLLADRAGNLWVGTNEGLNLLNRKTGKFTHYAYKPNDPSSLSGHFIGTLYEDHEGTLWVSCAPVKGRPGTGGLDSLNRATGKFAHFEIDSTHPNINNSVFSMLEDSHGNFWVGTFNSGLLSLNRKTGVFSPYPYDPAHPERLSAPPQDKKAKFNVVTFIKEDATGSLWIGSNVQGINQYDPKTKKITHYGKLTLNNQVVQDTLSGFNRFVTLRGFISKDGLLWISSGLGSLYTVNPLQKGIPYYPTMQPFVNAFYQDAHQGLWIATDGGLLYKPAEGKKKLYVHDPHNTNSPAITGISAMKADKYGNLWLGTYNTSNNAPQDKGNVLDKFDPSTGIFTHYTDSGKLNDRIWDLSFDDNGKILWMATDSGLYEINPETGAFLKHYTHESKDSNSLASYWVPSIAIYGNRLWAGTQSGLDLLNKNTGQWKHYLKGSTIYCQFKDAAGVLWIGAADGLYRYNAQKDHFQKYRDTLTGIRPESVSNILEDKHHNLWVSGTNAIYRISANRDSLYVYGQQYGIHFEIDAGEIAYQSEDGKVYMGNPNGYYAFYPDSLLDVKMIPPTLNLTGFQLGDKEILPGRHSPLQIPLFEAKEISLNHKQNSFSFAFEALHYAVPGPVKYRYMLEGYDHSWHNVGERQKVYYFNIPVGHYTFKVRAVSSNGAWSEKDIAVIIHPPWWTTWWAIVIYIIILIMIIWVIVYIRSRQILQENKILEDKVNHRTAQLKQSLEDLKSAQKQLIQSEKMASLGEMTAGIAHEIQNPLNFVNNFSEVSVELANELKAEVHKANLTDAEKENMVSLTNDLIQNQEKINFHGKRADAVVKSMLQHTRGGSGQKEMTDINALADEYFRLSYHGMRAKDKSFNATMKTDFDGSIGRINVVPQDIGRVLLNLFNNAFYATSQKQKAESEKQDTDAEQSRSGISTSLDDHYEPTVWVSTKRVVDVIPPLGGIRGAGAFIEIRVKDNGNGIPEKIKDKIFQPFFTTKPTGEGTGLGLSLSYDMIKAHGGEIIVNSKEGEGTEFVIELPMK